MASRRKVKKTFKRVNRLYPGMEKINAFTLDMFNDHRDPAKAFVRRIAKVLFTPDPFFVKLSELGPDTVLDFSDSKLPDVLIYGTRY